MCSMDGRGFREASRSTDWFGGNLALPVSAISIVALGSVTRFVTTRIGGSTITTGVVRRASLSGRSESELIAQSTSDPSDYERRF